MSGFKSPLSNLESWKKCKYDNNDSEGIPSDRHELDRVGHVAVCVMGELLVWGGYHDHESRYSVYMRNDRVYNYSLDMDRWSQYRPNEQGPYHTSGSSSCIVWPRWYILCGHQEIGHVNRIHSLNLETCTWEAVVLNVSSDLRHMIAPRDKCASWVMEDKIYVFGGYGDNPFSYLWDPDDDKFSTETNDDYDKGWNDQVCAFDVKLLQWSRVHTKGPKPLGRAAHAAARVGSCVYIFGGRNRSKRMGDLHRLCLDDFTWSGELCCLGATPEGRSWHTLTRIDGNTLILFGGFNDSEQVLDDLWKFDVGTLAWTLLHQHTGYPRLWHTACATSTQDLLIFGGCINNILERSFSFRMDTSDLVLTVRLEPYTLERLCLHALWRSRKSTRATWQCLSRQVQSWLDQRDRSESNCTKKWNNQSNAASMNGPSPDQISVIKNIEKALPR